MYQYPNTNQNSFGGDLQNPRGVPSTGYSPVPVNNGGAMAGAYDNYQWPAQTVAEILKKNSTGNATSNALATYGLGNVPTMNPTPTVLDRVRDGLGVAGEQTMANLNKMSYAEKGSALLGGVKGVFDVYNTYKTNKLANKQFEFEKDSFNRNFDASAKTTNAALADRQAARYKRDPSTFASVNDYMKKYGV